MKVQGAMLATIMLIGILMGGGSPEDGVASPNHLAETAESSGSEAISADSDEISTKTDFSDVQAILGMEERAYLVEAAEGSFASAENVAVEDRHHEGDSGNSIYLSKHHWKPGEVDPCCTQGYYSEPVNVIFYDQAKGWQVQQLLRKIGWQIPFCFNAKEVFLGDERHGGEDAWVVQESTLRFDGTCIRSSYHTRLFPSSTGDTHEPGFGYYTAAPTHWENWGHTKVYPTKGAITLVDDQLRGRPEIGNIWRFELPHSDNECKFCHNWEGEVYLIQIGDKDNDPCLAADPTGRPGFSEVGDLILWECPKDGIRPETTLKLSGTMDEFASAFLSDVTVELECADPGKLPSGCGQTRYRMDGGSWITYTGAFDVTSLGLHQLEYQSQDVEGNWEFRRSTDFTLDVLPSTTIGFSYGPDWLRTPAVVWLQCYDPGSGCESTRYRLNEGPWVAGVPDGSDDRENRLLETGTLDGPEGMHLVEAQALDKAGHWGEIDSRMVGIDNSPPETTQSLLGSLGGDGWYGSDVDVSLSCMDSLSGCAVTRYMVNWGGDGLKIGTSFTVDEEGTNEIWYWSEDVATNREDETITFIKVDKTYPKTMVALAGTKGAAGWYTTDVSVILSCRDTRLWSGQSGCAGLQYGLNEGQLQTTSGGITLPLTEEKVHKVSYKSEDKAGNLAPLRSRTISIDKTPPATTSEFTGLGGGGWFRTDVGVGLSCTDTLSGCASSQYRVNGGAWQAGSSFTVTTEGTNPIEYRSRDVAGNWEDAQSATVKVDRSSPETTSALSGPGADGWYRSDVDVSLSCADALSGCATTHHRVNGGSWQPGNSFKVTKEGTNVIEYRSEDTAGNQEAANTREIKIDRTPPESMETLDGVQGNADWFVSKVTIGLDATDTLSGVLNTESRFDDGAWNDYAGLFTLAEDGAHVLGFRSEDVAGNVEATNDRQINVDTTPPVTVPILNAMEGQHGWFVSPVNVTLSCTDATSGCAESGWNYSNIVGLRNESAFTVTREGVTGIGYRSEDMAGNMEDLRNHTLMIDTNPPTTSHALDGTEGDNGWFVSPSVGVALSCSDATSGCNTTSYRIDDEPWRDYNAAFVLDGEGITAVSARSEDIAGNVESQGPVEVKIDSVPPATDPSLSGTMGENDWYVSPVDVTLSCIDETSGCGVTEYRFGNGTWQSYDGNFTMVDEGNHTLEYRSLDVAGNAESVQTVAFKIDTTRPEAAWLSPEAGEVYAGPLEGGVPVDGKPVLVAPWARSDLLGGESLFHANATDGMSGMDRVEFRFQGDEDPLICEAVTEPPYACDWDPMIHPPVVAGEYDMELRAHDRAGNQASVILPVIIVV